MLRFETADQPLPTIGAHHNVHWNNVRLQTKHRRLFGHKVVAEMVTNDISSPELTTEISPDRIAEVKDPQLRYALRLQDAANMVGWIERSPGSYSAHHVSVYATPSGFDSQLVTANYSGVTEHGVDSFIENLRRSAPGYDGGQND